MQDSKLLPSGPSKVEEQAHREEIQTVTGKATDPVSDLQLIIS